MKWPPEDLDHLLSESAEILHKEGASEVYVFGSAATGRMHEGSDIDLAVSGLPPRKFFPTLSKLSKIFERTIDLIDLDEASPFTDYLKRKKGLLRRVA